MSIPKTSAQSPNAMERVASELSCGGDSQKKKKAFFHVTRASEEQPGTQAPAERVRKRSISTPQDLSSLHLQAPKSPPAQDSGKSSKKHHTKKKHFSLRKIFKKDRLPSDDEQDDAKLENLRELEAKQRQTELDFAHTLMTKPEEMETDLCRVDSEPDLVQTICAPNVFSRDAIKLDKKLYQLDVANTRIATLSRLSGTAVLVNDYNTLDFLQTTLSRIRKQNVTLFKEADKFLSSFKKNPNLLLCEKKDFSLAQSPRSPASSDKVQFSVADEDDQDSESLRWEMNSLCFSTENSSSESDEEGPPPEQVAHLAQEIRKAEGTRFKKHSKHSFSSRHGHEDSKSTHMPPPPNPLAHSKRALLRSHATVPNGLCQQGSKSNSSALLSALEAEDSPNPRNRPHKQASNLPFNLLSLTGQLSWLVSEYIQRDTSTYKWAMELIHKISTLSVTRATWLNVHQQLRETTELLYAHRDHSIASIKSKTAKGEVAWNRLQVLHESIASGDADNATVTAETAKKVFGKSDKASQIRQLVHLSVLMEKKFHLAYVCDMILWRAHKLLFMTKSSPSFDTAKYQLTDFRIRHMQLRLDQANVQNWSNELTDWMTCWIDTWVDNTSAPPNEIEDSFCVEELKTMQLSIKRFHTLVQHIGDSEFISDTFLDPHPVGSPTAKSESPESRQHHHYHPYLYHHGEGGHQQDLRPMEASRCSHTYAALVRQIHEHAMSNRPLSYFAERALYDIAVELDCPVDWKARIDVLLTELTDAYNDWESLLQAKLSSRHHEKLFAPSRTKSSAEVP